jgi:putative membrane protein
MNDNSKHNKQELARERTDWAEDRTLLANERTFAGWMRTGLGSLGIAIALHAVFSKFEPTWMAKSAATFFVVAALLIFWSAYKSSTQVYGQLDSHDVDVSRKSRLAVISAIMAAGSLATVIVLWAL